MKKFWQWLMMGLAGLVAWDRAKFMVDKFDKYLTPGSLLDLGCGTGHIGITAKILCHDRVQDLTLVDVVPRGNALGQRLIAIPCAKALAQRHWVFYEHYDGYILPYAGRSFKNVLLAFVLHHAADSDTVLASAWAAVAGHGRLIILEDTPDSRAKAWWNKLFDSIVNLEFCGHPRGNLNEEEWERRLTALPGAKLVAKDGWTHRLFGLPFLNTMFVLEKEQ